MIVYYKPITQKLHIILDGAGYHRSELVKDRAYVMNIELHYLPPYSPNLNPIERLWKMMNECARNNRYFATAKSFKTTLYADFLNRFYRRFPRSCIQNVDIGVKYNFCRNKLWQLST